MTLVRYKTPVNRSWPVDRLASEIFGSNIARFFGSDGYMDHSPRVNISERKDDFLLEIQVPGFDKNDLKIEVVDETLTIRGEHTVDDRKEDDRYTRREFSRSAFERRFALPQNVNATAIKADHTNGVLTLTIPKSEESEPKTRSINIR